MKSLRDLIYELDICHDMLKDAVTRQDAQLIQGKLADIGDIIRELNALEKGTQT
jgi:hypothetical protein